MGVLSTAAWVAHDLGLAGSFGGSLFGRWSMHPAVRAIGDDWERGKVVNDAWRSHRRLSALASGLAAATWLVGRRRVSGRGVGRSIRPLVIAKDALVGGMMVSALATNVVGARLARRGRDGYLPVGERGGPSGELSSPTNRLVRAVGALGTINALFTAGVIGVTALLAMRSGESVRWSLRSRLLA